MASMNDRDGLRVLAEGVEVTYLPAQSRDEQVKLLNRPWVADEGPTQARFQPSDSSTETLLMRGLAFDAQKTVTWDEDGVQVITAAAPDAQMIALSSPVLARERFEDVGALRRIDYLKSGVWLASRYVAEDPKEEVRHA